MLYVIIGLGKTGLSCARFLHQKNIPFVVTDSRAHPEGLDELLAFAPDVHIQTGQFSKSLIDSATHLVASPGVSLREPVFKDAISKGIPVIGDIELFAQAVTVPVVGITGSNGKSTVTTLVGEMINACGINAVVAGNIGMPALDALKEDAEMYVLELSSFQLETTHSLVLKVACVLNVSEDHMDRYDAFSDYVAAKQRIYQHAETAVFNRHDLSTVPNKKMNSISFGLDQPNEHHFGIQIHNGQHYLAKGDQRLLKTSELFLQGAHHEQNALASLAIGNAIGLTCESMIDVLRTFKGLPHRCQLVREHDGIRWINDSKGTNVGATIAAIETVAANQKKVILIAGGVGKGADFSLLKPSLNAYVKQLILIGESALTIEKQCHGAAPITHAKTLEDAITTAKDNALSGDVVLFSPACASFDMFKNYIHRGEVFEGLVNSLVM